MTDIIKAVRQFTEAVGCTTDEFNVRQTALYTGLQMEEMAEKLEAMKAGGVEFSVTTMLHKLSGDFKSGLFDQFLHKADRVAMLDADIDLAWVTIGSAISQGADVLGAMSEVARSNMSKLIEAEDGTLLAVKDENGKVVKPENFSPPNLAQFVCNQ